MDDLLPKGQSLSTKAARHGAILEILATNLISSQGQLRQELSSRGFEVTQATLSRDLLQMHATKVRNAGGALVYSVPDADGTHTHDVAASSNRLARWCQDLLIAGDVAENLLVLKTPVGGANLLGSAVDSARLEGVLGTVAGDDTIMVVCRDRKDAEDTLTQLLVLADAKGN